MSGAHIDWLRDTGEVVTTSCGRQVPVFEFRYDTSNTQVMSEWAQHFRRNYCSDEDLQWVKPVGKTNYDYLIELKFPSHVAPGPSIRSGDFAEILIADYLEFVRFYYVPRTRYDRKIIRNESSKGSDVIGFKWNNHCPLPQDELMVYEVKSLASESKETNVLQNAVDDSVKDEVRLAESLNAMRQRLGDRRDEFGVRTVDRFQNPSDHPYDRRYGAAAVVTQSSFLTSVISSTTAANHPHRSDLEFLVIRAESLMPLINALYERAANEA